jgi:hypothetical protein
MLKILPTKKTTPMTSRDDAWTPARQPGAKLLGDLCEVLPGRNRVAREADADPEFRVVRAEDIGAELSAWLDLPPSTMRKRSSVEVAAGDIVGSISAPYGRWVIVPDGYGPTLASDHTVVLRKHSDVSMWYLLGFMRSDRGRALIKDTLRGSVILRISATELGQISVPLSPLSTPYVDAVIRDFDYQTRKVQLEIEGLRDRLNHIYDSDIPVQILARLDALKGITASVHAMTDLNDTFAIAKTSFPYPIARNLRAMDRAVSPRERYHELVHEGLEIISAILASICAAIARRSKVRGGIGIKGWVTSTTRGGATIGNRLPMVSQVAASLVSANRIGDDIGGLGHALGNESAPANPLMKRLLKERNRIHGDYPRTEFQFRQRLAESENDMRELLGTLSFLARWELRYAESAEPREGHGGGTRFASILRILRGDNPDWVLAEYLSQEPLYPGRLYAFVDDWLLIDLYPYLLVEYCPQCGNQEVYYPNMVHDDEVHLNSIDRGHGQPTTDERLLRDLRASLSILI